MNIIIVTDNEWMEQKILPRQCHGLKHQVLHVIVHHSGVRMTT